MKRFLKWDFGFPAIKKTKTPLSMRKKNLQELRKKIRGIISESINQIIINELSQDIKLDSLKSELASAAQKVYDDWGQNEEGYCDWLGYGGICQDIAEAMAEVLNKHNIECTTVSQQVGEQHVYVVAKTENGVFEVDIPPYLYETGGGYCWKKISNVVFDSRYVTINRLSSDPDEFEQYAQWD